MALDDFTSEDSSSSTGIKTRKKLKNVQLTEEMWDIIIATHPHTAAVAANFTDKSSAKAIAKKMEEALDGGLEGHAISDELRAEIESAKDEIVEEVLN